MEWKGRRKKRREFQRVSKNDGDPGIIGERERDTCIYRNSRIINRSRKFRTFISILFSELKFSFLVFTVVLESSDDRSPFGKIAGCYLDFSPVIPRNDSLSPPPSSPVVPVNGSLRRQPSFYLPSREEVASVNRNGVESGDIPLAEGWRGAQPARSSVAREYGPCERSKSWPTSLPAFETFSSWRRSCVHVRVPRPSDGIKFSARCINIIPYRSLSLPKLSNGTESVSLHKFYSILFTRYFWRIGFSEKRQIRNALARSHRYCQPSISFHLFLPRNMDDCANYERDPSDLEKSFGCPVPVDRFILFRRVFGKIHWNDFNIFFSQRI